MVRATQIGLLFPVVEEEQYECESTANYPMSAISRRGAKYETMSSQKYKDWSAVQVQYMDMYLTERIVDLKILAYKTGSNKFMNKIRSMFSRK